MKTTKRKIKSKKSPVKRSTSALLTKRQLKINLVLGLLKKKTNLLDIMKDAKVSIYTIQRICKSYSIKYPKIKKKDTVYKAIANIKNGIRDQVTLAELGISRQRLNQIKLKAKDYGVIV